MNFDHTVRHYTLADIHMNIHGPVSNLFDNEHGGQGPSSALLRRLWPLRHPWILLYLCLPDSSALFPGHRILAHLADYRCAYMSLGNKNLLGSSSQRNFEAPKTYHDSPRSKPFASIFPRFGTARKPGGTEQKLEKKDLGLCPSQHGN